MNMDFKHGTVYSIEEINSLAKKIRRNFSGIVKRNFTAR